MSITVKLVYKGNCFKFAPNTNTISLIQQEMDKRYPNTLPPLSYYYDQQLVQDLQKVLAIAKKEGKNSVKLQARRTNQNEMNNSFSCQSSFIKLIEEKPLTEIKELDVLDQSQLMPKQFYQCYICKGSGIYSQNGFSKLCETCQGKGQLNHKHSYIQHLSNLFSKYIKPLPEIKQKKNSSALNQENDKLMVQKPAQVVKGEMPYMKFRQIDKAFHLNIKDITKMQKIEIGQQFSYKFEIQNIGIQFPAQLYLVDCDTKESRPAKSLKNGEKMTIEVGPFMCLDQSLLTKLYYLCHSVENSWMRIGYKFGLRVRGVKKVSAKVLTELMSESVLSRMRDLKSISNSVKSEQYLMLKLKGMGINIQKIQMQEQLLIQIIKSIQ